MQPRFTLFDWLILADVALAVVIAVWVRRRRDDERPASAAHPEVLGREPPASPDARARLVALVLGGRRPLTGYRAVIWLAAAVGITAVALPNVLAGEPIGIAFGLIAFLLLIRLLRESTRG